MYDIPYWWRSYTETCVESDWLLLGYGFTRAINNQSETAQIIIGLRHFFGFNLERWKKSAREEEHQMAKHEKKKAVLLWKKRPAATSK